MDRSVLNLSSIKEWLKLDVVSSFILHTGGMLRRDAFYNVPCNLVIAQKCSVETDYYMYFRVPS